jgi:NADPH-dependent 2,4-dienoyl-CoA reductase/sulfur reductase-like enzyme/rhodanese-related sulfurtransferase
MGRGRSIVIIGGAQGGPTAAARARAFDEDARIILLEKEDNVAWVQAGLRHHLEGNVPRLAELDADRAEFFNQRHRIDVRTGHEAIRIDVDARRVHVRTPTGAVERLAFDAAVFSGGAGTVFPAVKGIEKGAPGVVTFRKRSDLRRIREARENGAKNAVVLGCGPIGLDATEGLRAAGFEVDVVEQSSRIMPTLSLPAARAAERILRARGTRLHTGEALECAELLEGTRRKLTLRSGAELEADLVVVAIGMRPRTKLLERAGASLNPDGSVRVAPSMATTLPHVYACGTAVCVPHAVTRSHLWLPQAAIADRTAQIAGRSAAVDEEGGQETLSPVAGSALHQVGDYKFGRTGLSDGEARSHFGGDRIRVTTAHSWACEEWFGGKERQNDICVRMIVDTSRDVVVGGEVWGRVGVPRRLDILAAAVVEGWAPSRVAAHDMAYTPDIGPAFDPVNAAGAMTALISQGQAWPMDPEALALRLAQQDAVEVIDVGRHGERDRHLWPEGTKHIPLEALRENLDSLPKDRDIVLLSHTGRRAHQASRILRQRGFERSFHLDGGALNWALVVDHGGEG